MDVSAVLLHLVCLGMALAYPNGPPTSSCKDMFPTGHNAESQKSDPPYSITVGAKNYRGNVTVTLKALDGGYFEGVFVQARRAKCDEKQNEAVGSYWLQGTEASVRLKTIDCSGSMNALAHKDKVKKTELRVIWIPPPQDVGTVYFRGTFVKETEEFWTSVSSEYVADRQNTDDSPEKCLSAGNHATPQAFFALAVCVVFTIFISTPR